jgi:hypothetical protein
MGHHLPDDIVKLHKLLWLEFLCSKDMVPQQLATMEETILSPLNQNFLLYCAVVLPHQTGLQILQLGDAVDQFETVLFPITNPFVQTPQQPLGLRNVGL